MLQLLLLQLLLLQLLLLLLHGLLSGSCCFQLGVDGTQLSPELFNVGIAFSHSCCGCLYLLFSLPAIMMKFSLQPGFVCKG
jgi:hypothetical protein